MNLHWGTSKNVKGAGYALRTLDQAHFIGRDTEGHLSLVVDVTDAIVFPTESEAWEAQEKIDPDDSNLDVWTIISIDRRMVVGRPVDYDPRV